MSSSWCCVAPTAGRPSPSPNESGRRLPASRSCSTGRRFPICPSAWGSPSSHATARPGKRWCRRPIKPAMSRAASELAETFGYQRIETPIFEATELFVRAVGEATDIVSKEMFTFRDRGDRSLTLRPEGTAPIVRAYFDAGMQMEPQPVRLYYIGPYFRSERPQRGRFHEFRQFGIEAIGDASPLLDVEAIVLGWRWFAALELGGISLQLNSIGDEVCRPAYRELLRDYYGPHLSELSPDSRIRLEKNPLRLFDS